MESYTTNCIRSIKCIYKNHKYQVLNDQFHCSKILTYNSIGRIYHTDYFDNLSQEYKFELQSCHFNKSWYSPHCTVKHTGCDTLPYEYVSHLSLEMKHDFTFTSTVVRHLLEVDKSSTIHSKSDNCTTQCKSKYIFKQWQSLTKENGMSWLVDAMSGFGVERSLKRAVITCNFSYRNSLDIYNYLTETFSNNDEKHFLVLNPETIAKRREDKQPLPIKLCKKKHMISFSPDGSM